MNHHTDQRFQREAHGDARFSVTTRTAGHRMARHCNAQQGMELQSNAVCALEERAYRVALTRMQRSASHISAKQVAALPGMAKQRGSELGDRLFSGPLWPEGSAAHGKASHRIAPQSTAIQGNAFQSNADCPLATAGFPGRFGSPGRVSSAALLTD